MAKNAKVKKSKKMDEELIINVSPKNKRAGCTSAQNKKNSKKKKKPNKALIMIIKWTSLIAALIGAIILFITTPLFNIADIQIIGNQKINSSVILNLSQVQIGDNIYKYSKNQIKRNIKENAYIDTVTIKRKLPNVIEISVVERNATYMLELENGYAYINNQGYILEISGQNIYLPIITGFSTDKENITEGNRLCSEDLAKLEMAIKIMDCAINNEISELITTIDISDKGNYTLILETEGKKVYLGDASNITTRILYLKAILQKEKGIQGEVFINGNLTTDNVFFREKV